MGDDDKKLFSGLGIAALSITGYWFWWKTIFGESEFSMILMGTFSLGLLVYLFNRLK